MRGKILALIDNDSGQLCKKLIRLIIINMTILVKGRISMNIDDSVKFLNCHYKHDYYVGGGESIENNRVY